ncbi:MAG: tyrosine-type recombinase/integrase [Bacteroidales bacterium]|nr:tyrosine-type recombinase/integrase [Bacteroidales bacterium]MBQ4288157.1 tyrosine-type recombinase/integrase [Bacteroidales bacterium]MBQ9888418.1 tyrosine-type recombinase/integrase [Bacteroidales bacterium]
MLTEEFLTYLRTVKRYSDRTQDIYEGVLESWCGFLCREGEALTDELTVKSLQPSLLRSYEVSLVSSGHSARTVCQHMSALSSFCRWLMLRGILDSNPVKRVSRPKVEKRLPYFYKEEALEQYLESSSYAADRESLEYLKTALAQKDDKAAKEIYEARLRRMVMSLLSGTGIRRAELIGLRVNSYDPGRKILKVRGKGDKMREIPLIGTLSEEISLYLKAVEAVDKRVRPADSPMLVTFSGSKLYPEAVDRMVKRELEGVKGITGRKSPHVLRHTLATGLLNNEADLNSIKELLGHSSLAATQVYTHTSVAQLKQVYKQSHPRAKSGGKNGD